MTRLKAKNVDRPADRRILVHTDASQIFGKVEIPENGLPVDYLTVCGHKVKIFQSLLLPPFHKSRNTLTKSSVTQLLRSFLRMTARCPVSEKGLRRVSSARAHGRQNVDPGRADKAGPSLARDGEEEAA